jgi:hypothetical protein
VKRVTRVHLASLELQGHAADHAVVTKPAVVVGELANQVHRDHQVHLDHLAHQETLGPEVKKAELAHQEAEVLR